MVEKAFEILQGNEVSSGTLFFYRYFYYNISSVLREELQNVPAEIGIIALDNGFILQWFEEEPEIQQVFR